MVLAITMLHYMFGVHFIVLNSYKLQSQRANFNKKTYEDNRFGFSFEYDRANPITQNEANIKYLEFIKSIIIFLLFF